MRVAVPLAIPVLVPLVGAVVVPVGVLVPVPVVAVLRMCHGQIIAGRPRGPLPHRDVQRLAWSANCTPRELGAPG
ncbi:hypothetical protein GCM10009802_54840 [Streptomyces synnematoformans]|uniref:Uncharacterized protein n=1 Tax=Streptomyces synnematoformans TaxID=415721 RepID=A0ABN1ZJH2_9ACTN